MTKMTKGSTALVKAANGKTIIKGTVNEYTWPDLTIEGKHFYIPNATVIQNFDGSFLVQL